MSQYRRFHHLAAVVVLGAFAAAGCFVVDDTDSDDDDENGEAGESGAGGAGGTRGGSGGASTTGGSSSGGTEQGGAGPAGGTGGADAGGTGPAGGSSAGGAGPAGGTSSGGATTGGAAGTGGSTTGAVMKFCNGLARGGMDITLTLEFAGVTASALSGTCTPVVPNACIPIPTGANPSVELREGTEVVLSGSFPTVTVAAGDEMLVLAALDEAMMPGLYTDTFELFYGPGYTCRDTDPATDVPPTMSRSAQFDLPSQRNLRNVVSPSVYGETKSLGSWIRK